MTPGWRRWAAILTTYTCLVAGAIPYRIRVPPPGQLVALSGDDLRVELDLPPPGAGHPLEAPNSLQRRQGEAGREESAAPTTGGGRVRRDGELWIELVDMELEDERIRRRKEKKAKEEEGDKSTRWRRERGEGVGEDGEIGRREIGGWNRVEVKGKAKERHEKKSGSKRYGWVAGGVRPKGEKENILKVEGKEVGGDGRWREENLSGKWGKGEEGGNWRQKTEGKVWWKSWSGRGGGRGGGDHEGERRKGVGASEGGGGKGGEERGKVEEEGSTSGETREGAEKGEEGGTEEGERRRGLILESALVSRGWHSPLSDIAPSHRGPSPPHSTLALTFPASHFTHGGLYVVRLVGTGRMVANPGTQRPQRATPGREVKEGRAHSEKGAESSTRRGVTEVRKNSSHELDTDVNIPENQLKKPKEPEQLEEGTSEANTRADKDEHTQETNVTTENPASSPQQKKNEREETLEDKDGVSADDGRAHMFGRIVETLEERFRWNQQYVGEGRNLYGEQPEGEKTIVESAGSVRLPPAKRHAREARDGDARVALSKEGSVSGDENSSGHDVQTQKTLDGPLHVREDGTRGDYDGVGRKRRGDHSGLSDYGETTEKGQLREDVEGKVYRGGFEEGIANREEERDRRKRRRGEEWRCGEESRISAERSSPASGFRTYLESKARRGGKEREASGEADRREKISEWKLSEISEGERKEERVTDSERSKEGMKRREEAMSDHDSNGYSGKPSIKVSGSDWRKLESTPNGLRRKREDAGVAKEGTPVEGKAPISSKTTNASNRTAEGRASREAAKGCKGSCDSTTRHILAEENVLVSWPTARFTLNILSSIPTAPSPFSTPTSTSKDSISQNVTFGTFESPVKVVVEIPCGVGKVGERSKRDVAGGREDSDEFDEVTDINKNFVEVVEGYGRDFRGPRTNLEAGTEGENQEEDNEKEEQNDRRVGNWKKSKGEKEDDYRRWDASERNYSESLKRRKEEANRAPYFGRSAEIPESAVSETIEGTEAKEGAFYSDRSAWSRIRSRIRKERVTKFDVNDDIAERLLVAPQKPDHIGYSMKREASKYTRIESLGRSSQQGKDDLMASEVVRGRRRKRAAREEATEKARDPPAAGGSRDPETGLAPGPEVLPFRLFLVLRYCGPDSTECDEEEASHDDVDVWRRPQTVFTEELADFPECPNYRHQVILPCEAFGQAGVYMVQVRSNYTLKEDEESGGEGSNLVNEETEGMGGKRRRRGGGKYPSDATYDATTRRPVMGKEGVKISIFEGEEKHSTSKGSKIYSDSGKGGEDKKRMDHLKAKGEAGTRETPMTETDTDGKPVKGETVNKHGYRERIAGRRPGREADAWDVGNNWWEGSGDGEGDDGSGDWGDGWGGEGGRERRGGSGDGEYGDDPDGGERLTSPQKLPDPPPRSLWSSSDAVHVHLSRGYVFTVHARSVFPCSDAHVKPDTLEPAPSGVPVLFEYPQCILEGSDRVRMFGRARPDVAAILPPFWMGSDASVGAAATLSHPSLRYVAEKKIYKGKHTAWFDCSLFTERFSEYCFAYASEAMTGAVTHVRAQCIPTLPTSDEDRGGWGSWSSWSQCSTTCGSGSRNRYRTCDNPPPRYGAPFCEGTALETERCPPPSGVTYEELQEMCPLGLALSAGDGVNRRGGEPSCRCGGCIVHLQGIAGTWGSQNAGPIKARARLLASSSQACPGRSFWLLEAEPGHVVGLTVSSLLLPCPRRQWLKARDGDSLSSKLILHLPSSSTSPSLPSTAETLCFSSGTHLLLEFYSFERLEPTCNGGFLAHAHQVLANSSASAIGREILLAPTTRAVSRSSISVHAAALAFVLALVALSGGLALNYVLRRRRFNEELKKREKEEEEMSDSDSDTKCFISRNKDGGSATSVTSVSDVISLRKLSIGRDGKRREVHMRLREETDEDDEADEDGTTGKTEGRKGADVSTDSHAPAKVICPKVVVIEPGTDQGKKGGRAREDEGEEEESGEEGDSEAGEERKEGAVEVARRRRRKRAGGAVRREWRESACPLLEQETVAQSSVSLPSSPTETLREDPIASPNAPGRPGLSASAPLLLRRSLSFFAAAASASTAGAVSDSSSEGCGQSISAAGRQWWRKKMQRFQNGSVSPVREELEETWRLADPQAPKEESPGKSKKKQNGEATPAKECKEKQNRERLLRAGVAGYYPNPPSSTPSNSPSATTSPEMGGRNGSGNRLRGRLRARVDERGKCTSEASLAGGASELDLEFDYYDYNVQNAGAAPGSYLGMDPAFLVYIPPFEGSTSPSSEASSASTLQAPPSEAATDVCAASPPLQDGGEGSNLRGEYYCINASYARANFQDAGGGVGGGGGGGGAEEGSAGGGGEMVSMAEFRRDSLEEGRGSEKETRVEKSPALEDEEEIKFADDEEEEEEEEVERTKMEEGKYGMIKMENLRLKRSV